MKRLLTLLLFCTFNAFACGPFFPSTYLGDYEAYFEDNINISEELELIAKEYDLIGWERYPRGYDTTAEAERKNFFTKATHQGGLEFKEDFDAYATAIRAGDTNAIAPVVPEHLAEFVLYLEGTQEFMADPNVVRPEAWDELLALDFSNRLYRTTWVHYMLGNLAASHGNPEEASVQYAACRRAALVTKKDHSLGLAHASYKRDYLAQTNLTLRIERGIAAVGYYHQAWDTEREKFCMEHLQLDMENAAKADLDNPNMAVLEAMALFNVGEEAFISKLGQQPDLKITPRLAWFMYKKGDIEQTSAYLDLCPEDDALANWLRFRLAQREGRTDEAVLFLKKWINQLQQSERVVFQFQYGSKVRPKSAINGSLGTLLATQGQMMDAMLSFVKAGAYEDAALIAERYIGTDELIQYVNSFELRAPYHAMEAFENEWRMESSYSTIQLRLSYLLARRLFREGRPEEALPYYPPEISKLLNTYLDARANAGKFWKGRNTRSANLYLAARIMRWKGMELSGTELYPDYTIVNGHFPWYGREEAKIGPESARPMYDETAPVPNVRFHYRHVASDLAGQAATLSLNRHQKAMILWSAGSWIKNRHPLDADVDYKKLARIHFQPLAKAADELRWFPEATPLMDYVTRSEEYIPPKIIIRAAKEYETD
jgi:hypothetical protein